MAKKDAQEIADPGTPESFDPSKYDPSDAGALEGLTDSQLDAVYAHAERQPEAVEPKDDEGAESEAAQKDEVEIPAGQEGAEPTPETGTGKDGEGAPASTEPDSASLFAGKYKTADDLINGVSEAAKVLGLNPDLFKPAVEAARKANSFDTVAEIYRQLDAEIGRKGQTKAPTTAPGAETEGVTPTPATVTPEDDPQIVNAVVAAAFQQLRTGQLAEEMARAGIEFPTTDEQFEGLKREYPYYAVRFQQEYAGLFHKNLGLARERIKVEREAPELNARTLDSGISSVREFIGKYGLNLSDEQIATLKQGVQNDVTAFEDRHGVRVLRDGSVMRHFMAFVFPTMMDSAVEAKANQSVEKAMERLQAGRKAAVNSVSTAGRGTASRSGPRKVDLNDPDQVAQLSDEELESIR